MEQTTNKKKKADSIGIILYLIYLLMLLASAFLVVKIVLIQTTFKPDPEIEAKLTPSSRMVKIEAARGNILAEDGRMLALSYPEYSIFLDCTVAADSVWTADVEELSKGLAKLTGSRSAAQYRKILNDGHKKRSRYLCLGKKLTLKQLEKAKELPILKLGQYRGGFLVESRNTRHYPYKSLGRRTIGFVRDSSTGVGNRFIGLEGKYNEVLSGTDGKFWTTRSDFGRVQLFDSTAVKASDGLDIRTTLNIDFQSISDYALRERISDVEELEGGCVVIMDVHTGAVKAMVNLLRDGRSHGQLSEISNLAVGRRGEPGSVFKTSCLMMMLENGYVKSLDERIPTNRGVLDGYRYAPDEHITDYERKHGNMIPIIDGFKVSSNYMFRYLAVKYYGYRPEEYIGNLHKYHLGDPFEFDIDGLAAPMLPNPKSKYWSKTDLTGAATGYAVDETPLQILMFYNAIANKGKMMKPYLVEAIERNGEVVAAKGPVVLEESICSKATTDALTRALKAVTEEGTATRLKDAKCQVAGKTGTARVALDEGGYADRQGRKKQQGTFVGFFPADDPQYSIICTVYSYLSHKDFYGGSIPAATVREIVDAICGIDPYWQPQIQAAGKVPRMESKSEPAERVEADSTIVPRLEGLGLKDAIYSLECAGLDFCYRGAGHITGQSPEAGAKVKAGSTVKFEME